VLSGVPVFAATAGAPKNLGLEYDYLMMVENTTGWTGEINHVFHIRGSWKDDVKEYSIKLFYDAAKIQIVNITLDGCVGINASSFNVQNNPLGGYFKAVVKKPVGIPAGEGALLNIIIDISTNLSAGSTALTFENGTDTYYVTTHDIKYAPTTINGTLNIRTGNRPPEQPVVHGPVAGGFGIELNYSAVSSDFEGDKVSYKWDWGDGNVSEWIGPFNASVPMMTHYNWELEGAYVVKVKAKDVTGNESDWADYPISIAQQIYFNNLQPGYIYLRIFTFNKSYFYINLLNVLGAAMVISTNDMVVNATASSAVCSVRFEVLTPLFEEVMVRVDDNGSNGFSSTLNLTRGLYQITVFAYDGEGNLIDGQIIPYVLFLRIGQSSINGELQHIIQNRLLHH
jgi:hypothetical protein